MKEVTFQKFPEGDIVELKCIFYTRWLIKWGTTVTWYERSPVFIVVLDQIWKTICIYCSSRNCHARLNFALFVHQQRVQKCLHNELADSVQKCIELHMAVILSDWFPCTCKPRHNLLWNVWGAVVLLNIWSFKLYEQINYDMWAVAPGACKVGWALVSFL